VVQLPQSGPGKGKLIATISFVIDSANVNIDEQQWRSLLTTPDIQPKINNAREKLSDLVPSYMVPTVWVAVPRIPLLPSAKVDRKQVGAWLESLDQATFKQILDLESSGEGAVPLSDIAARLQGICAKVLGKPTNDVNTNRSWLGKSLIELSRTATNHT
jgi:hypothetical protein